MNSFIGRIDEVRNRSLCALRIGYGYVVEFVFRRATPKALGGDPHDLAAMLYRSCVHGGTVREDLQPLVKVPYFQTDPLPEHGKKLQRESLASSGAHQPLTLK